MKKRLTYNLNLLSSSQNTNYPAISVVIPLYNAEKYIGECLDSILMQTFQDFEVIVVDDCSTDNSVGIVKSYEPKFNGKLIFARTQKNSKGGGYVPRNMGVLLSHGEYICFVDADDFILLTALETLYKAAKEYDADVVYTGAYYRLDYPNEVYVFRDNTGKNFLRKGLEDMSTLTVDNPNKLVEQYLYEKHHHAPWSRFVQREFLARNRLTFPETVFNGGDGIWALSVLSSSKRYLRFPKPLYFRRCYDMESITRMKRAIAQQIPNKIRAFTLWLKTLNKCTNDNPFFQETPHYCYDAFKTEFRWILNDLREYRMQLTEHDIYNILHKKLIEENKSFEPTMPFFFTFIDEQEKNLNKMQYRLKNLERSIKRFEHYLTARFDIQLTPNNIGSDFQILSVSDNRARIKKSDWLTKDKIGYNIQSYDGKMEIITKATGDGKLDLSLRGMDIRNPSGKPKRIPYWIDYTKLIINGKTIFDTLTPTWHDKPYSYTIDVKADEEVKIEVEWLPHRNDTVEQKIEPPKQEIITITKVEPQIPPKFINFLTARIDTKLMAAGYLQILSLSDDKAEVTKPGWLQKNGMGYVVQSSVGELNFVAKSNVDGQVQISLKGLRIVDPEDKSERPESIPYWIDYTKLIINGKTIFDTLTPTWHDKPYWYTIDTKANEEIKVEVEWLPHRSDIVEQKIEPPKQEIITITKIEPQLSPNLINFPTARIDTKLMATGDLQILSLSDDKAEVTKPGWLQKNGMGYVVQSSVGELNFVAKSNVDGQVQISLKGLRIMDPEDKSERPKNIPYWIDYTKLIINGKTIFDNLTPTWHDKPYWYTIDVKANEEIKVEVEWLPHQSET